MAEVSIENQDIGFVSPRQQVRVKIAAYEFQKYGTLSGTVETVSADSAPVGARAHSSAEPPLTFKAIVKLQDQRLPDGERMFPLAAGMQISGEIVQRERTILEYLLSPVQRVAGEAGLER